MKHSILIAAAAALALTACVKDPISSERTDNTEIRIDKLFTHEGCTVFRFEDGGRSHYYTTCSGSTTQEVSCGKNCTRSEEITTSVEQ